MRIFLDADATPKVIKDILFRAAERNKIQIFLVANQLLTVPRSAYISNIVVPAGPDEADDRIVELVREGDLVITADIPLADRVIGKGGHVIGTRGELFSVENIKEKLSMRDLMDQLRSSGIDTGGPSLYSSKDRQAFANQLDRFLMGRRNSGC
jgi:uncharacterized protein YaiI (UPF0178 family)